VLAAVGGLVNVVKQPGDAGIVSMSEFVPSVNAMVGILFFGVAYVCYWIVNLDD